MRYQFYREHKYVSAALNDLERLIACADFCNVEQLKEVEKSFEELAEMLQGHAQYENERLHALLKQKAVPKAIYAHVEEQHTAQDEQLAEIRRMIQTIARQSNEEKKIEAGYRLYLTYRKFVADNLAHLHEEETQILPELQRLYSDAELRQVETPTYREMSVDDIVHMLKRLFPYMNIHDQNAFLADISFLEPEKFKEVVKQEREIRISEFG